MAIYGPVEIVDLLINSMVDLSIVTSTFTRPGIFDPSFLFLIFLVTGIDSMDSVSTRDRLFEDVEPLICLLIFKEEWQAGRQHLQELRGNFNGPGLSMVN